MMVTINGDENRFFFLRLLNSKTSPTWRTYRNELRSLGKQNPSGEGFKLRAKSGSGGSSSLPDPSSAPATSLHSLDSHGIEHDGGFAYVRVEICLLVRPRN